MFYQPSYYIEDRLPKLKLIESIIQASQRVDHKNNLDISRELPTESKKQELDDNDALWDIELGS